MSEHTPLPCPFCNFKARLQARGDVFWVQCASTECSAEGSSRFTEDDAIAAWNARAKPDPAPDIAGLVERAMSNAPLLDYIPLLRDLASALTRTAQERDAAIQLNNRYAWERDKAREERNAAERRAEAFWKPQFTAAEARLSSARDALEAISSPTQTEGLLWWQIRAREALAAIRALKTEGTKP